MTEVMELRQSSERQLIPDASVFQPIIGMELFEHLDSCRTSCSDIRVCTMDRSIIFMYLIMHENIN